VIFNRSIKKNGQPRFEFLIPLPEKVVQRNLWKGPNPVCGISQFQDFTADTLCGSLEAIQVIAVTLQQGLDSEFVGPLEKLGVSQFLRTNHLLAKGLGACIEKIDQAKQFQEGFLDKLPVASV
jgi:hypothetical protein